MEDGVLSGLGRKNTVEEEGVLVRVGVEAHALISCEADAVVCRRLLLARVQRPHAHLLQCSRRQYLCYTLFNVHLRLEALSITMCEYYHHRYNSGSSVHVAQVEATW